MTAHDPNRISISHANQFLNDEDHPSPARLRKLADDQTEASLEQLRSIADQFNVLYDENTTRQELYDRISLRMDQEADNEALS